MHRWLVCIALLGCGSKHRPDDAALKAQILSNDKKPIVLPPRTVDAAVLHQDVTMRRVAFEPQARDMERRATHFNVKVKITVDGPARVGSRNEEHTWKQATLNDFSVHHGNAGDSVDWVVTGHKAFVKHNKNDWRAKAYNLEHADILKRDVVMALGELMATFAPTLSVAPPEATRDNGRPAYRYKVESGKEADGARIGQARAVAMTNSAVSPLSLNGEIVVDKETGLILTAELKATLGLEPMASSEKGPAAPAQQTPIKVKLTWGLDGLEDSAVSKLAPVAPEHAEEDRGFLRPTPEVLGFFGGLKKPGSTDESHDEED
jgi:hypothetical protein